MGIAETLASDLQRAPGVTVMYREVLRRALRARTEVDLDVVDEAAALQLCRELGATWLIAGGYQRVGDRLRITARLVAVDTGAVVHTVKVDGTVEELFVLQDRVVDALGVQLQIPARLVEGEPARGDLARADDYPESLSLVSSPAPATAEPPSVDSDAARVALLSQSLHWLAGSESRPW